MGYSVEPPEGHSGQFAYSCAVCNMVGGMEAKLRETKYGNFIEFILFNFCNFIFVSDVSKLKLWEII